MRLMQLSKLVRELMNKDLAEFCGIDAYFSNTASRSGSVFTSLSWPGKGSAKTNSRDFEQLKFKTYGMRNMASKTAMARGKKV